jgi:hypothetical protein
MFGEFLELKLNLFHLFLVNNSDKKKSFKISKLLMHFREEKRSCSFI